MSKSRWSKMTDAEKKAYYAARKARKAAKAKAKAVDPAKKPDTKKPAPKACKKACPCKAEPKKEEPANLSVGEKQLLEQVSRATKERLAVENAVARIGRMLLELTCVFHPETTFIRFCVEENGKVVSYYGGNAAKKVPAKK